MLNALEFIACLNKIFFLFGLCSLGHLLWQCVPEKHGKGEQMIKWINFFPKNFLIIGLFRWLVELEQVGFKS